MARKATPQDGDDRLADAMATLIQNQAAFLGRLAETEGRLAEIERTASERFARIESDMTAILRVLSEHGRLLERLPEAVREKIGFKAETVAR